MLTIKQVLIFNKQIFLFCLLLTLTPGFQTRAQQVIFNRVSSPEVSYFGTINDITQDPQGYMWFTSWGRGLHRYDGYHFLTFIHDPANPGSLSSNHLTAAWADTNSIIWIGTVGLGLDRLDTKTGIVTHLRHEKQNPKSLSDNRVTSILADHSG